MPIANESTSRTAELLKTLAESLGHWQASATAAFPESDRGASDALELQILYEQWLQRESWVLRIEALPLLFGVDPNIWSQALEENAVANAEQGLWDWMNVGDGDARPRLKNSSQDSDLWEVEPAAMVHWWRTQGMHVPPTLETLLEFIMRVVGPGLPSEPTVEQGGAGSAREQLLGAALNVLSKWPERCRDANGFADGAMMLGLIRQHAALWFDGPDLPMSEAEAVDLLEHWLR